MALIFSSEFDTVFVQWLICKTYEKKNNSIYKYSCVLLTACFHWYFSSDPSNSDSLNMSENMLFATIHTIFRD